MAWFKTDRIGIAPLREAVAKAPAAPLLLRGLDWIYERAIAGAPGLERADDLAALYRARYRDDEAAIAALILWQTGKAGATGFVTGLGGLLTLPVAIPANLVGTLYIQMRLIAAIAHLRGHDLASERVRALAFACFTGAAAAEKAKQAGARLGTHAAQQLAGRLPGEIVKRHAIRWVPLVGGLVAGGIDAAATQAIGRAAAVLFAAPPGPDPTPA